MSFVLVGILNLGVCLYVWWLSGRELFRARPPVPTLLRVASVLGVAPAIIFIVVGLWLPNI